jgi:ABC-type sugar transport system ATPase subunit
MSTADTGGTGGGAEPGGAGSSGVTSTSGPKGSSLLELRGVKKSFGAVQAVNGVDLDIIRGEVTALVGDNGAGKSSLIKTISGLWEQDEGEILWEGKPVRLRTPKDSEALGITTIYQDLALCDNLDIVQNMFLGHEVLRHFILDEGSMEITAKKILAELEVTTVRSVRQPVASLSGGQRQSVAKAVMSNAKLVIMDEPTAALGVSQTAQVLALIKRLASNGVTVLVISHNLNDVFEVADRIAILRLGRIVASGPIDTFDSSSVVDYMTTGRTERVLATAGSGSGGGGGGGGGGGNTNVSSSGNGGGQ